MNASVATAANLAEQLASIWKGVTGGELPLRLRVWDGSETGPQCGPVLEIKDPVALRRIMWQPNQLGVAQAFIAGEAGIEGDLATALEFLLSAPTAVRRFSLARAWRVLRFAARHGIIGWRPPPPAGPAKVSGSLHSPQRDRAVVAYHYDLSNDFYQLLLDPSMAYSCGYWTSGDPGYTLAHAQLDKAALICGKLGLTAGQRLLDVGCGWGALSLYAASRFQVKVTAVTLSHQQRRFVADRVTKLGLQHLVEVRLQDYREVDDGPYDAICAIEMGEHVGSQQYPAFAALLHSQLAPGGHLLIQQMSRGPVNPGGGKFIETYIAPDMYMRPVGETVSMIEGAGFEIRDVHALREHYVKTIGCWLRTLEDRWTEVVSLIGEPSARVWRLYLAGGALAFHSRRMGVDHILARRPYPAGRPAMPAVRSDVLHGR